MSAHRKSAQSDRRKSIRNHLTRSFFLPTSWWADTPDADADLFSLNSFDEFDNSDDSDGGEEESNINDDPFLFVSPTLYTTISL